MSFSLTILSHLSISYFFPSSFILFHFCYHFSCLILTFISLSFFIFLFLFKCFLFYSILINNLYLMFFLFNHLLIFVIFYFFLLFSIPFTDYTKLPFTTLYSISALTIWLDFDAINLSFQLFNFIILFHFPAWIFNFVPTKLLSQNYWSIYLFTTIYYWLTIPKFPFFITNYDSFKDKNYIVLLMIYFIPPFYSNNWKNIIDKMINCAYFLFFSFLQPIEIAIWALLTFVIEI